LSLDATEFKFTDKLEEEIEKEFVVIRRSAKKKSDME